MIKILLVKAAFRNQKVMSITQPIGLMNLSSYMKNKDKKYNITIFDNRLYSDDSHLLRRIHSFNPDVVGISAITQEANNLHLIASMVKSFNKRIITVAGGPHPTQFFEDVLKDENIDFVIRGEGEESFHKFVDAIDNGRKDYNIEGLAYREGKIVKDNGRALLKESIENLPYPDYDGIEIEKYFQHFSMSTLGKRRFMAISTSRGCPYECIYCHNLFGRRYRAMSPERVISEMEYLIKNYNITDFEFVEDIFNLNRERTERILNKIIERRFNIRLAFPNGLRSDLLNEELIRKFKMAGTVFISFAVETGSPRLQKYINKRLHLEKVKRMIEIASDMGILCNGFFIIGFPSETREEILRTIDFALNSKLHTAYFFILNPFRGTILYEQNKYLLEKIGNRYVYEDYSYFTGPFNLSNVPTDEILGLQSMAYRKFYSNPWRILKIIGVYAQLPGGLRYLTYYGFKTVYLIIDRKINISKNILACLAF